MSILVYILAALLIGCVSQLPKVPTTPIRDTNGQLHEYLHAPKIGDENFCVIHTTYETIEKAVTLKIDLADN